MADVEALDALRRLVEPEQVAQGLEAREQRLLAGQSRGERRLRVALREIEEARAFVAHAVLDVDGVPAAFGERGRERVAVFRRVADDEFARHRAVEVILREERAEDRRDIIAPASRGRNRASQD
jgi:hypothetical protein